MGNADRSIVSKCGFDGRMANIFYNHDKPLSFFLKIMTQIRLNKISELILLAK
jgi:hypothetical protein